MKERYRYWPVVDGEYSAMMKSVIDSKAQQVEFFKDFHIWTDKPIEGAICHEVKKPR